MGAKKNQKADGGEQKKADGGKKEAGGGGGGDGKISVVLKADLHCEGCVSRIVKTIRGCDGVEDVKVDNATSKVTVTGKVDPAVLREKVEKKTHKQVVVLSPQPSNKVKDGGKGGEKEKKKDNKKDENSKENKGEDDKKKPKDKEPAVKTTVLKLNLHCEGCIQKINKIICKTKGYQEMKVDKQKDLVTVTGTMDVKALTEKLKKHLRREVEIVPPKKEGGEKKEKAGGGGGNGKEKGEKKEGGGAEKSTDELNKMQVQVGYPYMYGPGYIPDPIYYDYAPPPQMFSDENPNACSVM